MLLNCGVGEDSWESLGLQGDPTSPSWRRSVLGVHWKDWWWSWNSNISVTSHKELTHCKRPWRWGDWGQEEKGTTEGEMAGWHHWLDGHEFEWTPGVCDGQGGLACCDSWGRKESDRTERLSWADAYSPQHAFSFWPLARSRATASATAVSLSPNSIALSVSLKVKTSHCRDPNDVCHGDIQSESVWLSRPDPGKFCLHWDITPQLLPRGDRLYYWRYEGVNAPWRSLSVN